jgi:hypothetical protein
MSHDATRQNFNTSRRPTASPTPGQAAGTPSRMSSRTLSAGPSAPPPWLSPKSNDNNDDDDENIPFPSLSEKTVRSFSSCVEEDSYHNDGENGHHDHAGSASYGGSEGELVGLGHATLPHGGHKVTCQMCTKVTIRPHKRTLSEVMRAEKQLDVEEAAATATRLRRELKREKIEAAKRRLIKEETE